MYRIINSSENFKMSSSDILDNLHLLDQKLRENDMFGEIDLYGGAVMCLGLNARQSTHDIDAVFEPKSDIRQLIHEVAEEHGLPYDWINDGVKGFVSEYGKVLPIEFTQFTNLTVCMADPSYLFAMKCLSCRLGIGEGNDLVDIKFLANYLHINSVESAENLILKYYPEDRYQPKTHFMLEELFNS